MTGTTYAGLHTQQTDTRPCPRQCYKDNTVQTAHVHSVLQDVPSAVGLGASSTHPTPLYQDPLHPNSLLDDTTPHVLDSGRLAVYAWDLQCKRTKTQQTKRTKVPCRAAHKPSCTMFLPEFVPGQLLPQPYQQLPMGCCGTSMRTHIVLGASCSTQSPGWAATINPAEEHCGHQLYSSRKGRRKRRRIHRLPAKFQGMHAWQRCAQPQAIPMVPHTHCCHHELYQAAAATSCFQQQFLLHQPPPEQQTLSWPTCKPVASKHDTAYAHHLGMHSALLLLLPWTRHSQLHNQLLRTCTHARKAACSRGNG